MRDFTAIDVETTGLDARTDRIFQLGAVRFVDGHPAETYNQLLNPAAPLPLFVSRLTGYGAADLRDKPHLEAVFGDFLDFLGPGPLVAHNADFDLAFLNQAQVRRGAPGLVNEVYDTLVLARLVLPLARAHGLGPLAASLGLALDRAHDAAEDARAAGELYLRLNELLAEFPAQVLEEAHRFLAPTDVRLAHLVEAAVARAGLRPSPRVVTTGEDLTFDRIKGTTDEPPALGEELFDPAQLEEWLSPGGLLAERFPGYEYRPGQMEMLRRVAGALAGGRHLLVEAGTGTGKSMAYLLPAVAWAAAHGRRVVISTHTIHLQEQLWQKDIPLLREYLPFSFNAALLKGKSNYLCLDRWEEVKRAPTDGLDPEQGRFYARVATWLAATRSGDRAEIGLNSTEEGAWAGLSVDGAGCLGPRCRFFKPCYSFEARRRAEAAHVIVVNHALLLADLQTENAVIPEYDVLILDEAHRFEEEAAVRLGIHVDDGEIRRFLEGLERRRSGGPPGLLDQIGKELGQRRKATRPVPAAEAALEKGTGHAKSLQRGVEEFRQSLTAWCSTNSEEEEYGGRNLELRFTPGKCRGAAWEGVEEAAAGLTASLGGLAAALLDLREALDEVGEPLVRWEERSLLLEQSATQARDLGTRLADVFARESGRVQWVGLVRSEHGQRKTQQVSLHDVPIDIGPWLQDRLFSQVAASVLTSATLTVHNGFDYFLGRIGFGRSGHEVEAVKLPPAFDYRQQALLCVPRDLPDPRQWNDAKSLREAAEFLTGLAETTRGRSLYLFTSHRMLRDVYRLLAPPLADRGILTLAQGVQGGRSQLIEQFRTADQAVLLGTSSFWEGVDIPGEALQCVVLVRLPFWPPTLPVLAARAESLEGEGLSAFYHLTLPQAIIRFKQGFGRLIRTSRDVGVVVVLDRRVLQGQTRYGRFFLDVLPDAARYVGSRAEVLRQVEGWLEQRTR